LQLRPLPEAELRDCYAAADVYVFPNERQTWGLAPLEALAARTPVVLSSGAGVHDVLAGRPGVHVVPPRSPAAIADALRTIHAEGPDPGLAETRAWIAEEFTPERYAQRMAELYSRSA
jgi:glycosyltransferase involved in cell wall biosynthesis